MPGVNVVRVVGELLRKAAVHSRLQVHAYF